MDKYSKTNTYRASDGTRYTSAQIDQKLRGACRSRMEQERLIHGIITCYDCGINERHAKIDPSHDISVKECKEGGYVEKAWDVTLITPRCRDCHNLYDKLTLNP